MTTELKQKLNEVNRQKKQIETILLHMTDGIIAFNMDGNIIHINPAAKQLLNITDKEDSFEKIFGKIKDRYKHGKNNIFGKLDFLRTKKKCWR